jgi:arylsulfatase
MNNVRRIGLVATMSAQQNKGRSRSAGTKGATMITGRLLGVGLICVFCAVVAPAAPAAPNIVIILADDMGFSDIGCYGGEIHTPNLDALAAGGVRFTQFYNTGRCCPTRAALLTGRYPHQADMGWMTSRSLDIPGYRNDLSRHTQTIAEVLRTAGYSTYMSGKWHVTKDDLPVGPQGNWPRQRGFDRFYGTNKNGAGYFDPLKLVRDDTPITAASDVEYQPKDYYYTDAIADQAARFIREHASRQKHQPFFLYVAFSAPHWPLHAPAAAVEKYKGVYDAGHEPVRTRRFEQGVGSALHGSLRCGG